MSRINSHGLRLEQLEMRLVLSLNFVDGGNVFSGEDDTGVQPAFGDIDGDNDQDAFVLRVGSGIEVWINDGLGGFSNSGQQFGDASSTDVALGDMDADGDLDALAGDQHRIVSLLLNNGRGRFDVDQTFALPISDDAPTTNIYDVDITDLDLDGDLDAVFGAHDLIVLVNEGSLQFADPTIVAAYGEVLASQVSLLDIDNDGDLDLALSGFVPALLINQGSGELVRIPSDQIRLPYRFSNLLPADFDGDGDLDFVTETPGGAGAGPFLWLNGGRGEFMADPQRIDPARFRAAIADIDLDGDTDIIMGRSDGSPSNRVTYEAWLNDGRGVFSEIRRVGRLEESRHSGSGQAVLADVDGDGDLDVFASGHVWLTNGTLQAGDANRDLQFDQQDIVQVLQAAMYLTAQVATFEQGDWNRDGLFDQLDIVAALQTDNYLRGLYAAVTKIDP